MQETLVPFLYQEDTGRRDRLSPPVFLGFPCDSAGEESACNVGDLSSVPGLGRFPGEGKGYPFQYSGLENFMDYNPWGHKESDTTERLSHVSPPFYTMHSMWLLVFIAMLGMTLL